MPQLLDYVRQGETGRDGFTVVFPPKYDCFAAARMADAAPELLAACQAALENLAPLYCDDHIVMKLLRSAIAKAVPWVCACGVTQKPNAHWCNGCNAGRPSQRGGL